MRKIIALLFSFMGFVVSAQIELEHTYPESILTRVKFEQAGEKYYFLDRTAKDLIIYNANHTVWKTIDLGIPSTTPGTSIAIFNVSESDFNSDSNIEVAYSYYTPTGSIGKVIGEDGTPYFTLSGCVTIDFSRIEGAADKFIARMIDGASAVYGLPAYDLQTTFADGAAVRTKFEYSGEKYYLLDKTNNLVKVYHADFNFWKSLPVPMPAEAESKKVEFISESLINPDPSIELAYTYSVTAQLQTHYGSLISETAVLLSPVNTSAFSISQIDGLDNKLIVGTMTPVEFGPGELGTNVYHLPSLNLEHVYPRVVQRKKLEVSGEKFFISYPLEPFARIYNADHTMWRTVALPHGETEEVTYVEDISENFFNSDTELEIMYSYYTGLGYNSSVINEAGTILGTMYGAFSIRTSALPGLEKKIVSRNYEEFVGSFTSSSVYSIDDTMGTIGFAKPTVRLYPNPASAVVQVNADVPINKARIFNVNGTLLSEQNADGIEKISVENLSAGIYFFQLTDAANTTSNHKVIVSH